MFINNVCSWLQGDQVHTFDMRDMLSEDSTHMDPHKSLVSRSAALVTCLYKGSLPGHMLT